MTIETATATVHTDHDDIVIDLFGNHTPDTVDNFTGLAESTKEYKGRNASDTESGPFYDETIFHHIIAGFMIQGSDPLGTGTDDPGHMFDDEIHPEFQFGRPYLLAIANVGKHDGRGTNSSRFFITVVPAPHLSGAHTTLGEVADNASKKVVDEIARVATDCWDRPLESVVITSTDTKE